MQGDDENPGTVPSAAARRMVLAVVVTLPLLGALPTLAGIAASSPPRRVFLGFGVIPWDHQQYASFMALARDGAGFLMPTLLTPETHPGRFIATLPWLVGRCARLLGSDEVMCWWGLQYAAAAMLLLLVWAVAGRLCRSAAERLSAFLLATVVSGFAWIPRALEPAGLPRFPDIDQLFTSCWNWSLAGSLGLPLWCCAQAMLLVIVLAALARRRRPTLPRGLLLFAAALATWLVHPYTGIAGFAMLGAIGVARAVRSLAHAERPDWGLVVRDAWAMSPVLPAVALVALYTAWAIRDPVVASAAARMAADDQAFSILLWPLGLGAPLLLAAWGARAAWSEADEASCVLLAWFGAAALLAAGPWFSGYKFQFLVAIPAALLGARGLTRLRERSPRLDRVLRHPAGAAACVALLSVGTAGTCIETVRTAQADDMNFASEGELECLDVLRKQPSGILLAPPARGGIAAWKSVHPVFYGHHFLTVDAEHKLPDAAAMITRATPGEERRRLLALHGIRWVLLPPAVADLDARTWGRLVHASDGWRLIEVEHADASTGGGGLFSMAFHDSESES